MGTYRAVLLRGRGGLDQLGVTELPIVEPKAGELRIRVRATGAGSTDLIMRKGRYPYAPPFPLVPGYEVVGEVDAIGDGVSGFSLGQRVCALVVHGGQAELLVRAAKHFVPVPEDLDDGEVVALILNYMTAYQMIHRVAAMKPGQSALVTGANGGVGSAALELLRPLGGRVLGAASPAHFDFVRSLGAEPIASRGTPLDQAVTQALSGGVDVALDGLGGAGTGTCVRATKRGGVVVGYGFMATTTPAGAGFSTLAVMRGILSLYLGSRLIGRRGTFYGITQVYRRDPQPFKEDLPRLFELLRARTIRPRIAVRLPLLAGVKAQELIEAGGLQGKIVLSRDVVG
jgi:NADPH:quinone reductase-like Zn-dependent oxidoreductase